MNKAVATVVIVIVFFSALVLVNYSWDKSDEVARRQQIEFGK